MILARCVLFFSALAFTGYGLVCLVSPETAAGYIGYDIGNSSPRIEVMAMYGGLQTALGLIFLYCGMQRAWIRPGLSLIAICFLGLGATRMAGLALHGSDDYNFQAAIYECGTALLAIIAIVSMRKHENSAQ